MDPIIRRDFQSRFMEIASDLKLENIIQSTFIR
jgi:hypothetical protein